MADRHHEGQVYRLERLTVFSTPVWRLQYIRRLLPGTKPPIYIHFATYACWIYLGSLLHAWTHLSYHSSRWALLVWSTSISCLQVCEIAMAHNGATTMHDPLLPWIQKDCIHLRLTKSSDAPEPHLIIVSRSRIICSLPTQTSLNLLIPLIIISPNRMNL